MSTIRSILFVIIIVLILKLTCYASKVRYISLERGTVSEINPKFVRYANLTSRRYSRSDPFYYVDFNFDVIHQFHNNITIDFYFYEFLSNRYRRGFVEMHFKLCDMLEKDKFFGTPLRQGKLKGPCPYPPGVYSLHNMTIPLKHVPYNFPFTKGRIYINVSSTVSKEMVGYGHIDMEVRDTHSEKRNWVDN